MPIPLSQIIERHKLDPKSLEGYFNNATLEKRPKVKKLVESIRDTIQNGIRRNRSDYRLFKAMDWAFDTPFYQVSYTQLRGLLNSAPDERKVMDTVNSWGLTHLLPEMVDANGQTCCDSNGKAKKALNLPVFFNIFVPVVMAYITIRWAKLFNDRNITPLYKYEPVAFTRENRFRCDVLTQCVQKQNKWFGYGDDLKQSILQTLLYGFCINFPREAWFTDRQEDESGKDKIVREGLRWTMPHPSRTYYDLYHRLSSLNNNSGCEYAGFWELVRYKEVYNNPLYWNKDKITLGAINWFDLNGTPDFLQQVFPCAMSFPDASGMGAGGVGALDRQNEAARTYGNGDFDAATLLSQHLQRIIPEEHGLGTYKYPLWFRFVFASDSAVVWAEPLSISTIPTYTYDADFNRARFRSLALEIMPFQDHISNLLTQWILSVKENLMNPVFYDKEKVPANYVKMLENIGQKMANGRPFIPFSSTENFRLRVNQGEAFYTPQFTHHPTGEIATLINGIITMLDRIMQVSPQEVGQAAAHEQTAEESRIIANNTGTRVTFTGAGIDAADDAKKTALYDAFMAHADDNILVGVSSALANDQKEFDAMLKNTGFKLEDKESAFNPDRPETMHMVTGSKAGLAIEQFAAIRDNTARVNLPAIADAMSKLFIAVSGNPILIQSIGPQQLVELFNQILQSSGVPQEFRLKGKPVAEQPKEEQGQQVAGMLKEFAAKVQELVASKQGETLQAAAQQTQQVVAQALQSIQQQTATTVAQGSEQIVPAVQQAQQTAQAAAQQIEAQGAAIQQQQSEIESLNQAVEQLAEALRAGQPQPVA